MKILRVKKSGSHRVRWQESRAMRARIDGFGVGPKVGTSKEGDLKVRHLLQVTPGLVRPGYLETVPGATHRFEITRVFRIDFDLLTDAAHIDIDGTGCHETGIAPHGVQQVIAAVHAARV